MIPFTHRYWPVTGLLPLSVVLLNACGEKQEPATPAAEPQAIAASAWPITRGGPGLQGRIEGPAPKQPEIEWTYDLGSPGVAEAAVADGAIVVGDVMGNIHCIDLETRERRWLHETDDTIEAAPAISNGRVFVGSGDEKFLALDLKTGDELWHLQGTEKFSSAANLVTAPGGTDEWVLVNGYDGITRCLLAADGSEVWTYKTDDYINGTPAVIDGRYVAFGGCDKVVHVLNLADGTLANEVVTDAQITNSVATAGTMIYCGNYANQVIAAEATAENLAWIYEGDDFPFFTAPAVDERHVYIGCRDKKLHAIDRATGKAAWTFQTGGRVESSPLAFDDAIVFGSSDGRLYAAAPADGAELWRLDLGEDLTAAPVFAEGRIIIAGGDGTLFVLK
ncbi:PQQ-binding-like beta-propeller repeat protein [Luteolibacter marinus]|uniref:beta-alanine-activating enzyme beta-propeller domain-containing protein n=1 Tax=Luteolibacter marinus TaxID=2776705 RepID=UPI001868CDBB|nr:PQQ-binding-like beta-propeller repeat protein [Luteolibacter marinus]